jgi:hypothetical protein
MELDDTGQRLIAFTPEALDYLLRFVARRAMNRFAQGDQSTYSAQKYVTLLVKQIAKQLDAASQAAKGAEIIMKLDGETVRRVLTGGRDVPEAFSRFVDGMDIDGMDIDDDAPPLDTGDQGE